MSECVMVWKSSEIYKSLDIELKSGFQMYGSPFSVYGILKTKERNYNKSHKNSGRKKRL